MKFFQLRPTASQAWSQSLNFLTQSQMRNMVELDDTEDLLELFCAPWRSCLDTKSILLG